MKELLDVVTDIRNFARKTVDHRDIIDYCNEIIVDIHRELDNAVQREQDEKEAEKIIESIGKPLEPVDDFYCYSKVNGTTFREEKLGHPLPWELFKAGDILTLEREPDNPVDPNAIKIVYGYEYNLHIGYIPKETAKALSKLMDDGKLFFFASITEITGGTEDKTNKGLNIKVRFRKREE